MGNTIHQYGSGDNIAGDKVMGDKIHTQNNGVTSEELLQIIENLRQNLAQFSQEDQEELTIDINAVESEVKKPEDQRNQKQLRRRLIALAAAIPTIAGPIAATTDFANNITDLGSKVGIELQLPNSTQSSQP
ncbi:MAG: hypothetical protein AAF572_11105 [Cyanobacteria bacterium P01_B01_bin.77]